MTDIRIKQEAVGTSHIPALYPGSFGSVQLVGDRDFGTRRHEAVQVEYEVAGGAAIVRTIVPLSQVRVLGIVADTGLVENVIEQPIIRGRLEQTPGLNAYLLALRDAPTLNEIVWPTTARELGAIDFDQMQLLPLAGAPEDIPLSDCRRGC